MSRTKKAGCITILIVAVVASVWISRRSHNSRAAESLAPIPATSTFTVANVSPLVAKLTSQDPATYKAAWAMTNTPPPVPPGTGIIVDTSSFHANGQTFEVDATGTIPGKQPMAIVVKFVSVNGTLLVGAVEEVK